ncbi:MAG: MBOAT family protein [Magnetospirillum sp.]|nr:MBOAT family protein [Magnetospirillum sp.]
MLFQSHAFMFGFLPLVLAGWLGLRLAKVPAKGLMLYLVGVSLYFYGSASLDFLALLAVLTIFNFLLGRRLHDHPGARLYWLGVAVNLGVLIHYKYSAFAVTNLNWALGGQWPVPATILPLAISFFTFQKIGYLTDIRRGHVPRYGFLEFGLFVWFFPQLMAGPIVRHSEMIPQLERLDRRRLAPDLAIGFTLFAVGLAKKIFIADSAALYADFVFDGGSGPAPRLIEAWIGAIAYALQIYFDFSGYTDMAIGLARLFGIRLPLNFFSPYQSTSIIEFWRRWHITLSRFLRDYLYVSLGGNRHGPGRRYANLMVVMLLGGLWHGASWTFVIWGGLHGAYLVLNHAWRALFPAAAAAVSRRASLAGWALTLLAVMVAWIPFRAADFDATLTLWRGMAGLNGLMLPGSLAGMLGGMAGGHAEFGAVFTPFVALAGRFPILMLPLGLVLAVAAPNPYRWMGRVEPALRFREAPASTLARLAAWRPNWLWAGLCLGVLVAVLLQNSPQVRFLYWQF